MGYNVYLVEDEYMLREYVKSNAIWKDGPYTLCGDASNGEDAWEDIQATNVDILVTDIKMPFMDGLELSRLVRANRPEIKIIILSGYDDFAYAKQALSLGATEYLLKPLKPDDLRKTLDRAARMIDEERRQQQSISELQKMADESLELNRHRFLSQLCSGFFPQRVIDSKAQLLQLRLAAGAYTGCVMAVHFPGDSENDEESYLTFLDCSQTFRDFSANREDIFWFSDGIDQFRFIFLGESESGVSDKAVQCMRRLVILLTEKCGLSRITAAVGNPCGHIGDLYSSMLSANVTLELLPQTAESTVVLAGDCRDLPANVQYTSLEKEMFRNLLASGSVKDVPNFAASMVEKLERMQMSHLYLTYVCLDILTAVSDFLKELGYEADATPNLSIPSVVQLFGSSQDLSSFQTALRDLATQTILLRDQRKGGKNDSVIRQAREFMMAHFSEPDLDLAVVAGQVNVNPAYFSTLFRQETGQCFIEYLTLLRINKAKTLLKTTQMRTSDIAFEVGYSNQNYFSKLFKKCTGMSARDFRQS